MSEVFELMQQARGVAETAKDAMNDARKSPGATADQTTVALTRAILKQAKSLLPNNSLVQSLDLETTDWSSVRSAMQAVENGLSAESTARRKAGVAERNIRRTGGEHAWMMR